MNTDDSQELEISDKIVTTFKPIIVDMRDMETPALEKRLTYDLKPFERALIEEILILRGEVKELNQKVFADDLQ